MEFPRPRTVNEGSMHSESRQRTVGRWLRHVALLASFGSMLVASDVVAVVAGEPAPALALPTAGGDTVALDRLRGRVVYVDFWASWCGPCRRSFPWMNEMHAKYGPAGLTMIGVNVDKRRPDAERFLQQTPAAFTIVYDPAGSAPEAYGVKGMPSSYLIDGAGNVVAVESGFRDGQKAELEARIRALLARR